MGKGVLSRFDDTKPISSKRIHLGGLRIGYRMSLVERVVTDDSEPLWAITEVGVDGFDAAKYFTRGARGVSQRVLQAAANPDRCNLADPEFRDIKRKAEQVTYAPENLTVEEAREYGLSHGSDWDFQFDDDEPAFIKHVWHIPDSFE